MGSCVTGGPLSLSNIGSPFLPVLRAIAILLETLLLLGKVLVAVEDNHGRGSGRAAGSGKLELDSQGLEAKGREGEEGIIWVAQGLQRSSE